MKKFLFTIIYCVFSYYLGLAQNCISWLGLPSNPSYVAVGDLDVPGNQITVEAEIDMILPFGGGPTLGSDIVAKYADPSDANYLLRAQNAQITTTNGFFKTPDACSFQLNKTYHIAMVYNGSSLKYYRNGFLVSQIPATGNLVQNNWRTQIGFYQFAFYNTNFIGYINEVRIWNVARTQAQIQTYMNTTLPSPATQVGLLAYYTFDDLLNKQGNPAWNGILGGSALINQANPTCAGFVADNICCPVLVGTIEGNSICPGKSGMLTFHATATSNPPYTITYSDGTTNYIQNNVQDGVPFAVQVQPTATTNYSLVSIQDAGTCPATNVSGQTATINFSAVCDHCNNWLDLPGQPAYVQVGNLNVTGNQMTVEAEINRTAAYTTGTLEEGDVVSKHDNPTDVNYLLRPNHAYITTTDGYYGTPDICDIKLNKTYHIAMVYDGVSLKFYRNGFLMSQVAATGNLVQNSWQTRIGFYFNQAYNENFIGYINEVRIWSVARTQAQIQAYMNSSLPSPAAQPGLLAYYSFDDLVNKQGNPAWNGILGGSAAVNQTNPTCAAFAADNDCCVKLAGSLTGNTICAGGQGLLSFHPVSTPVNSPFVISYSDGMNTYSQQNVQDGVPFPVAVQPGSTSNFILVSIKDAGTCAATAITGETASILVHPSPVLQTNKDTAICSGSSVQLQVSGAATYQWTPALFLNNDAISNPVAAPGAETKFYVTGTDLLSCQGKDSVLVSILPDIVFKAPPDVSLCAGSTVKLNGNNSPAFNYQWTPADYLDDPTNPNPVTSTPQTVQYNLKITDPVCGSNSSFPVSVQVNENPVVKASKSNDIDCQTGVSQLNASGASYYEWTPASGIDNPRIADPEAAVDTTTLFTVTGTDQNACFSTDTVTVKVTAKGKALFILPNAFTPNYDGINDCFGIKRWGNVKIDEFSIYNRWGQRVFETRNPDDCWNGTCSGVMQDTGQYVYVVKAESFCGSIVRTGTLMLIR